MKLTMLFTDTFPIISTQTPIKPNPITVAFFSSTWALDDPHQPEANEKTDFGARKCLPPPSSTRDAYIYKIIGLNTNANARRRHVSEKYRKFRFLRTTGNELGTKEKKEKKKG